MTSTIIVSIISLLGTFLGTIGGIITSNKLTEYRLKQLEEQVKKHNSIVERMYKVEQTQAVHEEDIKVINHRIHDLEHSEGG